MLSKILFFAIIFTSCTAVYKSSQTPDDVYFSPAKLVVPRVTYNNNGSYQTAPSDNILRMQIYDYRWRTLDEDYGYSYNYSPYNYSFNNYNNYGYYYNPFYCSVPLYYPMVTVAAPTNTTPRMINLNSYNNYNIATTTVNSKARNNTNTFSSTNQYNNSNSGSRVGNFIRQVFVVNPSNNYSTPSTQPNQPSTNYSRTYSPAASTNSGGNSSSSSSGGSSGGSVSRPGRGG